MLVSALLMSISIAWALYDEAFGRRPWKGMQKEFVSRYTRYLDSIKADAGKSETEIKESPEYQQLEADEKTAREAVQPEIQEIDAKVAVAQRKLDAITDTFQNQRGRLTVISYNIETTEGRAKERWRQAAEEKKAEEVTVDMPSDDGKSTNPQKFNYVQLEALYDQLRDDKAKGLGRKAELLKTPSELSKKRDDYLKTDQVVLKIVVPFLRQFGRRFQQLSFTAKALCFVIAELIVKCFKLSVVELLRIGRLAVVRRHVYRDFFRLLLFSGLAPAFLRPAFGGFDVVADDGETAALVLERVGDRVKLALSDCYLRIDLLYFRLNRFASGFFISLELLILGTLLDLRLALSCVSFDTVQVTRVAADKLLLHSLPGPLAKRFVVQRPGNGDRHQ